MSVSGAGAKRKGAGFEREIANTLTASLGLEFKRGLGQARNGGAEAPDVYSDQTSLHIECKHQKAVNLKAAMKQALRDSAQTARTPVVVARDNNQEILVMMRFSDWQEWVKQLLATGGVPARLP